MFCAAEPLSLGGRLDMSDLAPAAYRSLEPILSDWIDRVREQQAREWPAREAARRVAARRIARAVGGAAAFLFGTAAFGCAIAACASGSWSGQRLSGLLTPLLLSAWPAALVAWAVTRLSAGAAIARRVHAPIRLTGVAGDDLLRLQSEDSLAAARTLAARWERAGAALPLAALSIVAPLSLHFLVWCLLDPRPLESFGSWIGISVVVVGHAHVALCVCAVLWARALSRRETIALGDGLRRSWVKALLTTVGVASLPGLLLVGIPPLLVAVTGLVFVPAMYAATVRCMRRERLDLAGAD
jgi:hypothetical protein